jgi:Dolichyl-phosphate-mannose-protein mannosyltransferase
MRAGTSVPKTEGTFEERARKQPLLAAESRLFGDRSWVIAGLVATAAALLLLPSLLYPFGRDQGVFTDVAQVLLRGGAPYRDVWDIKPPGIYALYASIVGLFGPRIIAIRAIDLIFQAATAAALYMLGRSFLGSGPAALGALWYAALYLRCGYWGMAQAEGFANLPTLLAFFLWLAGWRARRPVWIFAAGMLAGSAALLKFPAALPCAAAPAWTVLSELRGERRWRPLLAGVLLMAVGAALPVAAAVLLLQARGAWDAYVEIQRGFVAPYTHIAYGSASWWVRGWSGNWGFAESSALPCALAAVGVLVVARAAAPAERSVLFGWLGAAVAAVWSQGKYFQYHWVPVLMPLGLLAGAGLWMVVEAMSARHPAAPGVPAVETAARTAQSPPSRTEPLVGAGRLRAFLAREFIRRVARAAGKCRSDTAGASRRSAGVGLLVLVAWSLAGQWPSYRDGWRVVTGELPRGVYDARFGPPFQGDYSYLADVWAAGYVRATTRPDDEVFIWGFEPLVYVLSERRTPTRFHFAVPLVSPWAPQAWRRELLRDLAARPPSLFLVLQNDPIPWASGRNDDSRQQLAQFPELDSFLRRHYRFERQLEDFSIFRRLGSTGADRGDPLRPPQPRGGSAAPGPGDRR